MLGTGMGKRLMRCAALPAASVAVRGSDTGVSAGSEVATSAGAREEVKVGLATIGPKNDKAFSRSHYEACGAGPVGARRRAHPHDAVALGGRPALLSLDVSDGPVGSSEDVVPALAGGRR